ncbi:MAG: calcium-binding protein P [Mediterranea sp.]|jgi:hypothetical protein|nr:calcium-binding protein P [Mediterranea sp.]
MRQLLRIFILFVVASVVIGIYGSCSDESDCSMTGRPMVYCTLKTINPDEPGRVVNDTLDSLTVTALGTDSIILNNQKGVHQLVLPLRYTADTTVFLFRYDPVRNPNDVDTVYVTHKNTPYFQSMECGYMMKQSIASTPRYGNRSGTTERVDSIYLRNKDANSNEIENLQIFFVYRDRTPAPIE